MTAQRRVLRRQARGRPLRVVPMPPPEREEIAIIQKGLDTPKPPAKATPSPVMTQTTKELILVGIGFLGGLATMLLALMFEAMHRRGWLLP